MQAKYFRDKAAHRAQRNAKTQRDLKAQYGEALMTCVMCSLKFRTLNSHVQRMHGVSWRDYLIENQLPLGYRATTPQLSEHFRSESLKPARHQKFLTYAASPERIAKLRERGGKPNERIAETFQTRLSHDERAVLATRLTKPQVQKNALSARRAQNEDRGLRIEKICSFCSKQYSDKRSNQSNYCSRECYTEFRLNGRTHEKVCARCKEPFYSKQLKQRFCSIACKGNNKGISKV